MKSLQLLKKIQKHLRIDEVTGCWEWQRTCHNRSGHGRMSVHGKMKYVHRLMYEIHKGPVDPLEVVRHKCDNPKCCRPSHLELGSVRDNNLDKQLRGRVPTKLTVDDVRSIRVEYANGYSIPQISWWYDIPRSTIYDVIQGKNWKFLV